MKKIYVFLVIIGILLFWGVQLAFNQSPPNRPFTNFPLPSKTSQNEIGRYQYFSDPDGSIQGFLDTKEGFILFTLTDKWEVWDLKSKLFSYLYRENLKEMERTDSVYADTSKKKEVKTLLEEELKSQFERIR